MSQPLYINPKGYAVNRVSYSSIEDFNFCPRKFFLKRAQGWKEKREPAAFAFGKAFENAHRAYHEDSLDLGRAIVCFEEEWARSKDLNLDYTKTEKSWEALFESGREMLRLYAIWWPTSEIASHTRGIDFQVQIQPELFPDSEWAGLEFTAYLDMVIQQEIGDEWGHECGTAPFIIDIKTAGRDLDDTPGIVALDPQLRTYAWLLDTPDVGFMWFQKVNRTLEKGSEVTLLVDSKTLKAGDKGKVLSVEGSQVWVAGFEEFEVFSAEAKGKKGKNLEAVETQWCSLSEPLNTSDVTKQRFQFATAYIDKETREQVGEMKKREVAEMIHAQQTNRYHQKGDVRGFNVKCPNCEMLGICTKNEALRDEKLVQITDSWGE